MKRVAIMKNMIIIISRKKLFIALLIFVLVLLILCVMAISTFSPWHLQVANLIESDEIAELEKENSRLSKIFENIIPDDQKILYEDKFRNVCANVNTNTNKYPPSSFKTYVLTEVLKHGIKIKYKKPVDDPYYLRPLYDPSWKGFYFRGWLYLPRKNIEARHKLFVFPFGGSAIFDFTGSLGLENFTGNADKEKNTSVDYHKNINFIIYGFNLKEARLYENQLVLAGEPLRKGVQIVSIVQDDLLSEKLNTKDLLIQLSTPKGFEIDNIYGSVIRYEYLKQKIKEHSVKTANAMANECSTLEKLLDENLSIKKELSYFLPVQDVTVTQEKCRPIPPDFPYDEPSIAYIKAKAKSIPFSTKYYNNKYMRPVYDPIWLKNHRSRWCFIPSQICLNMHRFFLIPRDEKESTELFGMLGFNENLELSKENEYSLIIYNYTVDIAAVHDFQILLTGKPSNTGLQVISLSRSSLTGSCEYLIRLLTPDGHEVDYTVIKSE